jgi:hypothetical protein
MLLDGCSAEKLPGGHEGREKSTQVDRRTFVKLEDLTALVWQASLLVLMRDADCIPTR